MGNSTSFCRVAVKTIHHLSGKTISPQLLFVKFDFLTSKKELKNFWCLANVFPAVYSKVCFTWPEKRLTKNKVLRKKFLKSFVEVELFAWNVSSKFLRPVVKNALYVSGSFFEEFFLTKKILPNQIRNIKWTFSACPRNLSTWSSKLRSISPDDPFEDSL